MNSELLNKCVVYYTEEGYIVAVTGGWFDEDLGNQYSYILVPYANPSIHYVVNGNIADKTEWVPEVDGNRILNVPPANRVYIDGDKVNVTDGVLELDKPNSYKTSVIIDSAAFVSKKVIL